MMSRPELLRLRKEYEYHVEKHPSERWEAKLETVNFILSWHENEAETPVKGAAEPSRNISNFPTTVRREGPSIPSQPRRERPAPATGGA